MQSAFPQEQPNQVNMGAYPFSRLLPVGLFLLEKTGLPRQGRGYRQLLYKMADLYGWEPAHLHVRLHWAAKIVYALMGLGFFTLLLLLTPKIDHSLLLFGLLVTVALFAAPDFELDKRVKKRQESIQRELPELLNKIILLACAGMPLPRAWEKIARETGKDTPLYRELKYSLQEIQAGKGLLEAYEGFARRCRAAEVSQFVTLVIQNMKKGDAEMIAVLRVLSAECWEKRKQTARRLGEEASTKLLFPMMLMLAAIMLIVLTPALLAMKGL